MYGLLDLGVIICSALFERDKNQLDTKFTGSFSNLEQVNRLSYLEIQFETNLNSKQ